MSIQRVPAVLEQAGSIRCGVLTILKRREVVLRDVEGETDGDQQELSRRCELVVIRDCHIPSVTKRGCHLGRQSGNF